MIDRRKTGVNRVQLKDGNGGELDVYTGTVSRIKAWAGAFIAVATVCGMVFAAARVGVGIEVHETIEAECEPNGEIDQHVQRVSKEYMEEVQGVIQDDLDDFENRMLDVEKSQIAVVGSVDALVSDNARNVEEIKMLIQKAIDNGG